MAAARQIVLVVDDDETVRVLLRGALERAGFAVVEASDGEAALAAVGEVTPRLVLLEVVLPGITGYEVYELLRQRLGEQLPIVFLSGARTDRYDRIAGLLLGADDYVVKPFDPDELVARVRRSLRRGEATVKAPPSNGAEKGPVATLTAREQEILVHLARGSSTTEVARDLVITPRTVGTHVQHILAKLAVSNRGQAVAAAYRAGLVDAEVSGHAYALADG